MKQKARREPSTKEKRFCQHLLQTGNIREAAARTGYGGPDEALHLLEKAPVRAFLEKHPEFVPETSADYLPEPLRARCENGMAQFLSHRDHVEGFFIARMRRKGV